MWLFSVNMGGHFLKMVMKKVKKWFYQNPQQNENLTSPPCRWRGKRFPHNQQNNTIWGCFLQVKIRPPPPKNFREIAILTGCHLSGSLGTFFGGGSWYRKKIFWQAWQVKYLERTVWQVVVCQYFSQRLVLVQSRTFRSQVSYSKIPAWL